MEKPTKKLSLSKETLRTLDDDQLVDVVGGATGVVCVQIGQSVACAVNVDSVICHSAVCGSAVCGSVAICQSAVC